MEQGTPGISDASYAPRWRTLAPQGFKAKSSLLNALMFAGKDVLPKAATPMTASLTVLRYSEQANPYAEVEYFLPEDVNDMRLLAEEYDERFRIALAERQKAAEEKAARPGARALPKPDPERLKASVKRELDADPRLGGAKDMYERIRVAGGLPANETQRIEGRDLADLQTKLADYVGAGGRFTPFTKCLSLYLPLPALEGVDVVDTPGVNDPIRSREERTMEELHNCDVVFVVSPSGQFLNQQDLELMGRLTYKDGVREVFLVASQIDGQLFGSERDKHEGRLPDVLQGLRRTLASQAGSSLGAIAEDAGESLRRQLNSKIQELFSGAQNTAEQSKDYEVEYTDPSTLRKFASLLTLGLVSAERTSKTVQTIDSTKIRSALEGFQASFSTQITTLVDNTRQGLRKKIEAGILAALREHKVVNDRDIDTTRLAQACRSALAMVRDFDDPELPSLPSNLMQNGTLKGSDASSYESAALEYLAQLKKLAAKEARVLTKSFEERLNAADVGNALFAHYEEHLNGIKAQIGNTAALIESRYNLVCNILNSKPAENAALSELKGWLAGEFARDVQRLELPADVTSPALEQANAIGLHAELISDSPALRTKFLVAVAGGFSSGKSSFVTSFMRKEYSQLLAKGIQPVTAIPTYVMPGCELSIYGHTSKGAHVELSKDEYAQLTHDFIANMGFSVKEIMPHVVIESPMPGLKHLAFIDMPGYDPAASDTVDTAADHGIASAALSEADAVIWLVALDSNGTLPANDLEFLLQHADDRPLYVVLNKADLRPLANLEAVIEEIKEHLEDSGIQFEGICAYSSTLAKELLHEGKSLSEVMNEWDHLSDAALVLHKDFDTLVTTLEKHSSQQLHKVEMVGELAHSLELDILEIAGSESTVFQTAQSRIKQLKELAESIFGTERSEVSRALENMRLCGHKLLQANFGQLTAPSQRNEAFTD